MRSFRPRDLPLSTLLCTCPALCCHSLQGPASHVLDALKNEGLIIPFLRVGASLISRPSLTLRLPSRRSSLDRRNQLETAPIRTCEGTDNAFPVVACLSHCSLHYVVDNDS
jgi:hypothetical protein